MKNIEVIPYDPLWPQLFKKEAQKIKETLGDNCVAIHHVGSTSVPGLTAKPRIDIIVVANQPEKTIEKLESIGFQYRGEYNIPMHFGFSKRNEVSLNLHVYQVGNPEIELNLTFRDYLRRNPTIRNEYALVKQELLEKKSSFQKNNSMFTGYSLGKDAFIRKVLSLAGFQSLRFVFCTHYAEWEGAKKLRQKYFFDKVPIKDPYEWTFNHENHVHFILYRGVTIIGYAHIQLWSNSRAAIRILVIDEKERGQGFGKQFLNWIEKWLKEKKGIKVMHTESAPNAVLFYRNLGYTEMPFNDPDGYAGNERDTPMGKILHSRSPGKI